MSSNVNTSTNIAGDNAYTTVSPADNNGLSFRFPYEAASSYKNVIKDISMPSKGIYVTKISNDNKYYFHGDYSNAVIIDNNYLVLSRGDIFTKSDYKDIRKLNYGTTLANCVGWAHGRIIEIWDTAKSTGYIKQQAGVWTIPSKNNQAILCGLEPSKLTVPAVHAYSWYSFWPSSAGWTKSTKYQDDARPCPGAVICWQNMTSLTGLAGHVGVVEAVYNYGQEDEYIIVSMSGYSLTGAKNIVWLKTIYRNDYANGAPFSFGKNYKFAGFLFSPVCQLLPVGGYLYTGAATYTTEPASIEVLEADGSVYAQINAALAAGGKAVNKDLSKGQSVQICWFGSSDPNTDNKINLLGGEGVIVSVDKSNNYPYAVSLTGDGVISGYFNREALKVI